MKVTINLPDRFGDIDETYAGRHLWLRSTAMASFLDVKRERYWE